MRTIHTDSLTAVQLHAPGERLHSGAIFGPGHTIQVNPADCPNLHHLGPLLPADTTYAPQHTIAVDLAECPDRGALIAWLNAAAPSY